jgi:hypothetical protein
VLRERNPGRVSLLILLVFINLLVHDHMHLSPEENLEQYHMYKNAAADMGVHEPPSAEMVLWSLMTDTRRRLPVNLDVLERAIRISRAAKVLEAEQQVLLADTLCDFLLMVPNEAVVGPQNWWKPEQFAQIIENADAKSKLSYNHQT